jgi:hypothetical protein
MACHACWTYFQNVPHFTLTLHFTSAVCNKPPSCIFAAMLQVDGPSMFPTFTGRGDWVVAEALPGLSDRVQVGECVCWTQTMQTAAAAVRLYSALSG